jgi:hypothetical protein
MSSFGNGPDQDDDLDGRPDEPDTGDGRPLPVDDEPTLRPDAIPGVGYAEDDPHYNPGDGGARSGGGA